MAFDREADPVSTDLLILQRARDAVARGWMQVGGHQDGWWFLKQGNTCLVLAVSHACGCDWPTHDRVLATMGFGSQDDGYRWNDAKGRKKREVLARFDAAISQLRGA